VCVHSECVCLCVCWRRGVGCGLEACTPTSFLRLRVGVSDRFKEKRSNVLIMDRSGDYYGGSGGDGHSHHGRDDASGQSEGHNLYVSCLPQDVSACGRPIEI
jgi:hypothetical protein